jgi:hypothetical protein
MIKRNFGNQKEEMFCTLVFLFCINDNRHVNLEQLQVMRCLLCYNAPLNVSNPRTNARKGFILQNKWYNVLKKQVNANHHLISKKLKKYKIW